MKAQAGILLLTDKFGSSRWCAMEQQLQHLQAATHAATCQPGAARGSKPSPAACSAGCSRLSAIAQTRSSLPRQSLAASCPPGRPPVLAAGRRVGRQEQPGAWQASWSSPLAPSAHRPHRIKAAAAAAPLLPLPAPNCAALPPDLPLCSATMTSLSHLLEALEAALQRCGNLRASGPAVQCVCLGAARPSGFN